MSPDPTDEPQSSPRYFAVTVPAEARYLRTIRAFFSPLLEELLGSAAGHLVLALDEACSNVVKYRAGTLDEKLIHVRVTLAAGRVVFRIGDFCHYSDIPRIRPRNLDEVRPGGLGTHFIEQIMDQVRFEPEPGPHGRMALVLEKGMPGEGAGDAAEAPGA